MQAFFMIIGQLVVWVGVAAGMLFAYAHRDKFSDKLKEKPDIDKSPYQYLGKKEKYVLRSVSKARKINNFPDSAPFEYNIEY